jgi:hypothetical protein
MDRGGFLRRFGLKPMSYQHRKSRVPRGKVIYMGSARLKDGANYDRLGCEAALRSHLKAVESSSLKPMIRDGFYPRMGVRLPVRTRRQQTALFMREWCARAPSASRVLTGMSNVQSELRNVLQHISEAHRLSLVHVHLKSTRRQRQHARIRSVAP